MADHTAYREELVALSRSISKTSAAAAESADVTLFEWNELNKARAIIRGLSHKQWQRDTFTHTLPEEIAQ